MNLLSSTRYLSCLIAIGFYLPVFSQADLAANVNKWKTQFPKEEVVAYSHKEIVSFSLNPNPKPGEGKVRANVTTEIVIVPVKDFVKYNDGLFFNDEVSIDNLKVINTKGKDVMVQKLCGSYQQDDIFHSDSKVCSIKFPLEKKNKFSDLKKSK